jgi:hypothetical protein
VTVWVARADAVEAGEGAVPWPALVRRSAGDDFAAFEPSVEVSSRVELPEDLMRHLDAVLDQATDNEFCPVLFWLGQNGFFICPCCLRHFHSLFNRFRDYLGDRYFQMNHFV